MKIQFEGKPIDYARGLSTSDLKKVIKSCKKGEYDEFTDRCRICFQYVLIGDFELADWWSNHAELVR